MRPLGLALCGALCLAVPASAATYTVATSGSDASDGVASPFRTLQKAASVLQDGDTILLRAGAYTAGAYISRRSITLRGEGEVVLDGSQGARDDGLRGDQIAGLTVENLKIRRCRGRGIFITRADGLTVRNCELTDNTGSGLLTGNTSNVRVERTVVARNGSHGIYLSQSGDRLQVLGCTLVGNQRAGLQINAVQANPTAGDPSNDSLSRDCRVEGNTAYGNGAAGGAALQFMGVRESLIVNNLLYGNLSGGITLYDDGAGSTYACKNNRLWHNTVVFGSGVGRYGVQLVAGSTGNELVNNILVCGAGPAIETAEPVRSNHNCLWGASAVNGGSLAAWRSATGNDQNSQEGNPGLTGDYRLAVGSPARDGGAAVYGTDKDGGLRPQGPNPDVGCYEADAAGTTPPPGGGAPDPVVVYADTLAAGWQAAGKGVTFSLAAGNPVQQGSRAISLIVSRADGRLDLSGAPLSLSGKSVLKLAVHGGASGGQNLRLRAVVNGVPESFSLNLRNYGGLPRRSTWIEISIPLADLKTISGPLTGLHLFAGQSTKKAYLDHIRFE